MNRRRFVQAITGALSLLGIRRVTAREKEPADGFIVLRAETDNSELGPLAEHAVRTLRQKLHIPPGMQAVGFKEVAQQDDVVQYGEKCVTAEHHVYVASTVDPMTLEETEKAMESIAARVNGDVRKPECDILAFWPLPVIPAGLGAACAIAGDEWVRVRISKSFEHKARAVCFAFDVLYTTSTHPYRERENRRTSVAQDFNEEPQTIEHTGVEDVSPPEGS